MPSFSIKAQQPAPKKRRSGGFSLVELLVVIAIISILLVVGFPIFVNNANSARQSSREIVKAQLQQARSHAIASGIPTAIAVASLESNPELGGRAIALFEVEKSSGDFIPLVDAQGRERLLQRWEKLPGNFHFLSAENLPTSRPTILDSTAVLEVKYQGTAIDCHFIVFAPNGQIVHPAAGNSINIALAQATRQGTGLRITQQVDGSPVFDFLEVNRLTGRTRFAQP